MAGGVTVSNGLAWSPDGRTLYWSDTKAHRIQALDFDGSDGSLSRPREFASFEPKTAATDLARYGGRPDGAAVDSEGAYWTAMFEGQRLLLRCDLLVEDPCPVLEDLLALRVAVVTALGQMGGYQALVESFLNDLEESVAVAAAAGLEEHGSIFAIVKIRSLMAGAKEPANRLRLAVSLAKMGDPLHLGRAALLECADLIDHFQCRAVAGWEFRGAGAQRFVVTDDAPSNHWKHGDRHLLEEFCARVHRPVMARGGIHHVSDLHALHELVPHGLDGIIIDEQPFFDGSFTYTEAVAAGADRFDMFFWGPPQ